jgi:hypothetical protein
MPPLNWIEATDGTATRDAVISITRRDYPHQSGLDFGKGQANVASKIALRSAAL